jgi:hypothetical protein
MWNNSRGQDLPVTCDTELKKRCRETTRKPQPQILREGGREGEREGGREREREREREIA